MGNANNLLNQGNHIFENTEVKALFGKVSGIAQILWERGWAERNAGNFSVNITGLFPGRELERLSAYPAIPLMKSYPSLGRTLFLISGTGTRMRDMAKNPAENCCFVYVGDSASSCHIVGQGTEKVPIQPTSELAAHLAIQQQLLQNGSGETVVLHAHVTELIALTQLAPFTSEEAVNSLIWRMHPETLLFLPDGVGFIPYTLAGTENIAMATLKGFEKHKVVLWEKHGCMSIAKTLPEAFDHLDILAKSAKIYFLCKSTGLEPEGLTIAQLKEIVGAPSANPPVSKKQDFSI